MRKSWVNHPRRAKRHNPFCCFINSPCANEGHGLIPAHKMDSSHILPTSPSPTPATDKSQPCEPPVSSAAQPALFSAESRAPSIASPVPSITSTMTPPLSSQMPQLQRPASVNHRSLVPSNNIATPPPTIKLPSSSIVGNTVVELPTQKSIQEMEESQLRELVFQLIPALSEARVSFAHAKLQHSLLSIETAEAAQRAAVEHEITRREVDVLQAKSPMPGFRPLGCEDSQTHQLITHQLDLATRHAQQLETENLHLQQRFKQAKRLIKQQHAKNEELAEDNKLLRQRIKQHRDHMDAMQSSGVVSFANRRRGSFNSPSQRTGARPLPKAQTGGQGAFDALLFAGQVLNGETASVPSTPTHLRPPRFQLGHSRASHSLSSLPITPTPTRAKQSLKRDLAHTPPDRIIQAPFQSFSAPHTRLSTHREERNRDDRDSTISASDNEEAYTDDDVPASQASNLASNMLRNSAISTSHGIPTPGTGTHEKMASPGRFSGKKMPQPNFQSPELRRFPVEGESAGEEARKRKKAKLASMSSERLGLGIGMWPSPG